MARARDQKRWRANTRRKRIEVYLSPETADRLDALACERGQKRPAVIAALIDDAAPSASPPPEPTAHTLAETASPPPPDPQATQASASQGTWGYKIRRPSSADEKRYNWIAVTDEGRRIALGPDPARFWRWSGQYLDGTMFSRQAKGNTRDEVVRNLMGLPISTGRHS